jgi:hypothetical protein
MCPLPKEKKDSTQEETLHRISQTLAEFSFLVEHQSPPKTTIGSISNVFIKLTKGPNLLGATRPYFTLATQLQINAPGRHSH